MDGVYILYIAGSVVSGIVILLALHYLGDFPFPWQIRRITRSASEPDSLALSECFQKLSDNEEIHVLMGNINHKVCEQDKVINSLEQALKKNISVKLIHGPIVDEQSVRFLELLRENANKIKTYQYPEYPPMHFRVLLDPQGPREVYVEEPHVPFEDNGFRRIASRKASKEYERLFQTALVRSEPVQ